MGRLARNEQCCALTVASDDGRRVTGDQERGLRADRVERADRKLLRTCHGWHRAVEFGLSERSHPRLSTNHAETAKGKPMVVVASVTERAGTPLLRQRTGLGPRSST